MHELPLFLFVRPARQRPRRLSGKSIVQIPLFRGCQARVKTSGLVAGEVVRNAEGLAKAQCNTVRLKLLKIGAQIRITVRKVWVSLSTGYPYLEIFRQVHRQLQVAALRC